MNGRWQPGAGGTTLLLVSERAEHRASLHAALEAEGHRILAAESARAGLGLLEAEAAAVLSQFDLPRSALALLVR